ncbi:MAG TPA: GNAT family protein, partial [Nitriliruptorales bacterium]
MTQPNLQGRVIRLRPVVLDDQDRLVEIRATDEVRRWWRGDDLSAEFREHLARHHVPQFAILNERGQVIGMIQYSEETDPDYRHASIDLYVDPSCHRRGYGSDAIRTLADHLFDGCGHHRLTIDPSVENKAAIACYRRVGFRTVGVMRAYERNAAGEWSDGLL